MRPTSSVGPLGGLPIVFAVHVLCRVLAALDHAHNLDAAGETFTIVHGNVRPQNIYLTYLGEVKLAGFGVPRSPPDGEPAAFAQARSDRSADILATGVVMRELLSQRLRSTSAAASPLENVPRVTASDAQAMQMLMPICERALERDLELRYATAEEMQNDLLQVLDRLKGGDAFDVTAGLESFVRQLFERERREYAQT
jgi:serine/threonine-protein kinase